MGDVLSLADGDVSGWSPRCRRVALVIVSSVSRYVSPAAMKEVYQEVRTAWPLRGTLFKRFIRPTSEAQMQIQSDVRHTVASHRPQQGFPCAAVYTPT
jgi:hypothetical protein